METQAAPGKWAVSSARWRARHPKEYKAGYTQRNPRYYAENRETILEQKHQPKTRARNSARRTERRNSEPGLRERDLAAGTRDRAKHPERILFNAAKQRARKYKIEFSITIEDLLPLPTHCPVFKTELEYGGGKGKIYNPNAASIDQINPSRGYVRGNIAIISRRANSIKNDGTATEHRTIATWMDAVGANK